MKQAVQFISGAIAENEIGDDDTLAYKFSDPDGRAGRSGYSFGRSQFDTRHNADAIRCLLEAGFTNDEIAHIIKQVPGKATMLTLEEKLRKNRYVVDRWDHIHMSRSLNHVEDTLKGNVKLFNFETLVHIVDYHNQFYLSPHGKLHTHLLQLIDHQPENQQAEVRPMHILDFKINNTKWGLTHQEDIHRRYNNIKDRCSNSGEMLELGRTLRTEFVI